MWKHILDMMYSIHLGQPPDPDAEPVADTEIVDLWLCRTNKCLGSRKDDTDGESSV
jgi:hypothetical protein